jgi:hypothetical protein
LVDSHLANHPLPAWLARSIFAPQDTKCRFSKACGTSLLLKRSAPNASPLVSSLLLKQIFFSLLKALGAAPMKCGRYVICTNLKKEFSGVRCHPLYGYANAAIFPKHNKRF